jgi:hypothetical protein
MYIKVVVSQDSGTTFIESILRIRIRDKVFFTPWIRILDEFFSGARNSDPGSFWLWLRLILGFWKHKKQEKNKFAFHFSYRDPDRENGRILFRDKTSRTRNTAIDV